MYKQVIAIRRDLKLSKGKVASQAAHASLGAYKRADGKVRDAWDRDGSKKVVVGVGSLTELETLHRRARQDKLPCYLVRDAGRTEVEPGTVTALGIGPVKEAQADKLTGKLKML